MLLRQWTAVLFSLWACGPGHSEQDSGSSTSCHITANPEPQYVSAYRMHYRPGRGCFSNNSSPSYQLVHVINLKLEDKDDGASRRPVSLKIEPKDFSTTESTDEDKNSLELHQRMLVFVLNSEQPVKWKVEISGKFQAHNRQLFLVQSHSTVRFKKRKGKARVHMRGRRRNMPSAEDERSFLSWVKRKYKAVTSYSEVDGDKLLFYVGQADVASSDCRLNEMKPSPYAMIAQMDKQPVSGCISTGKKNVLDRPVYIIELLGTPNDDMKTEQRVELDIVSGSGKKLEHDFYLVLRSHFPDNIKWVMRSHRIQGWIDVITDADADLRGIRMHTVALRREVMGPLGTELIRWAEYYIAPVRAYAAVSSANILQLVLPSDDTDQSSLASWEGASFSREEAGPKHPPPRQENPSSDMRDHLKHIIKTRCEGGMMEVALPSILTQARELDLPVEQLSLLDRSCRATKNRTHVVFRTTLGQCQTRKITVDDEDVYSNAIVIHASGMVGAILEEELGSGYFDLQATSGSGWMEPNGDASDTTYMDDEDFASHKVEIDVECRVPRSDTSGSDQGGETSQGDVEERDMCDMQVYDDPLFMLRVSRFPYTTSSATGIYIQASAPNNGDIHVLMENCWVTQWPDPQHNDEKQIVLVQQGCTRSPGTTWVRYEVSARDEETTPERLMIYRDLPHGSYVHCQLAMCYKGSSAPGQQCPPDPSDHCNSNVLPNIFPRLPTRSCGIHTVGPLEVTDKEVRIVGDPNPTQASKPRNNNAGSKAAKGEGQTQQSVIIEGLDSGTVVGIAFAAFAIGILLTGALWFIHTHTGPSKRGMSAVSMVGTSGDMTPNSSSPISA